MKRILFYTFSILAFCLYGCDNYDDQRLPARPVHIEIYSAQWSVYGVHGYMESQTFVKSSLPKGFSWTANSYSGFGGVLLACGHQSRARLEATGCRVLDTVTDLLHAAEKGEL